MAMNSSVTGITTALLEVAGQISHLPGIDTTTLTLFEGAMLLLHGRDGLVSIHTVLSLVSNRLPEERIKAIFLTLAGAGILTRQYRDRRGIAYDQYGVDPNRLRQILQVAGLLNHAYNQFPARVEVTDHIQLIATLPNTLPLSPEIRRRIPSLVATLHRLITTASREIIILNPFFEQEGFNRLASALLAAADRNVAITIITRQLSDVTSVNYRVMKQLQEQSEQQNVTHQFQFYEYYQIEAGRITLTSHAKVMLLDDDTAYIGSANLTEHGLDRFIEVGVVISGSVALDLKQLVDSIIHADQTQVLDL